MKLQSVIVVVYLVIFCSLAFGTRPDTSYNEGPLHSAAYHGDLSAVKALVRKGADVNEIGMRSGNTPLRWVVNSGRVRLVSFSPAAGTPNFPKPDKKKILEYIEIARFLVRNGADVNIKDEYGRTVLHQAVSDGKMAMAEIIIREGRADVNVKDRRQITPLHVVKNPKIAKLLISAGADVHGGDKLGDTPLHKARGAGITKLLIEAGAKVDARNKYGATPLHYADDVPSAKLMIDAGADIHVRTRGVEGIEIAYDYFDSYAGEVKETGRYIGKTPLHYAVKNPKLVKYFIGLDADVNAKDNDGATPLHDASFYDSHKEPLNTVKALVRAGSEVNAKDTNGLTPLHLASHKGHLRTMEYLVESGADVHAKDNEGRVPLHVMVYEIKWEIMELLDEKNIIPGEKSKEFMRDFIDKHERYVTSRIMDLFKQKGLDFNVKDNKGRSPLHYLTRNHQNAWFVKKFIQSGGVDVNVRDNESKTPLHGAMNSLIFFRYPELIEVFISAGADINARDNEGKTLLHYVGRNEAIANTLVTAGASRSIKDNTGKIPMDYASNNTMRAILQP